MKYCWSCGAQIEDNVAFCTECGEPQDSPVDARRQNAAPMQSSQNRGLSRGALAGIAAGAVLLCLVIGFSAATCARDSASRDGGASVSSSVAASSVQVDAAASVQAEEDARKAAEEEAARKAAEEEAQAQEALRTERMEAYNRILAAYQAADRAGNSDAGTDSPIGINPESMNPFVLESELVWTTYDVSGDGEEELLVARNSDGGPSILYELVGYDANAHEPRRIGSFTGYRSYCTICEDGYLLFEGSGGANTGVRSAMRLPEHATEPVLVEMVEWDFEGDFDNVKFWYTDADGNRSECDAAVRDELSANYQVVTDFDWAPVADYVPGSLVQDAESSTEESGAATGDAQSDAAVGDSAASEEEQAQAAAADEAQQAREQVAVAFATQYFTNTTVDPNDHTNVGSVGDWQSLVQAYFEPGSPASDKFYNEIVSNPFGGLGAGCIAVGSEIVSSEGNTVKLNLSACGTQNPMPGWADPANAHVYGFTCTVSENNLIESYEINTDAIHLTNATDEAQTAETVIATADFTMDVPEYWRGKVTWDVGETHDGQTQVVFYPANTQLDPRPDFPVASVWVQNKEDQLNGGDYISHVAGTVEGETKRVCVSTRNYAALRAEFFVTNPNYSGSSQEDDLYNALLDLQFGGNLPMSPQEAASNASNPPEASQPFVGGDVTFVEQNVLPLIRDVA